jgi:glucosamine 6-phosphate synthetase-like amidotransferase/phosphosugar isomerase protein
MCGQSSASVGTKAGRRAVLIESLKRLEYRGYDSAGIAGSGRRPVERRRAPGKIRALEEVLAAEPLTRPSASATPAGPPTARRPCATPTRTRTAA